MKKCKSEGELRAFLDAELSPETMAAVQVHLETCPLCQAKAARLEADSAWVSKRLEVIRPESTPSATRALAGLNRQAKNRIEWKERIEAMFRSTNRHWRPVLVSLALVLVVVVAFSFEPVRVAAKDFLSIFRVKEFAVIPVDPEQQGQIAEVGALLEQNFFLSEPTVIEQPEGWNVSTLDEASAAVGFTVRTPTYLPEELVPVTDIGVSSRGVGQFEVDLELARSLFELLELDPTLLPDSLGEEPLELILPPMATQTWEYQGRIGLTFIQVPSPSVDFPDDVDPTALGAAALQLLGMDEREATRMSENIDWTNTLVLPLPTDVTAFREVAIDGTRGLLITEARDEHGAHSALMWQKDGIVYFLEGNLSMDLTMDVADSIP
jgi:hypothetical protein